MRLLTWLIREIEIIRRFRRADQTEIKEASRQRLPQSWQDSLNELKGL